MPMPSWASASCPWPSTCSSPPSEDAPDLDVRDVPAFLGHMLERADWTSDLHFQTRTTMDTLDYSGTGLNEGSKVVVAAAGPKRRELAREIPPALAQALPEGFSRPALALPGLAVVEARAFRGVVDGRKDAAALIEALEVPLRKPRGAGPAGNPPAGPGG